MKTECTRIRYHFKHLPKRRVEADFSGGTLTSDAGGVLLGKVEERFGVLRQFADCFTDYRTPYLTEHSVLELVSQRVYGIWLGYEDLNDDDDLRCDPNLFQRAARCS